MTRRKARVSTVMNGMIVTIDEQTYVWQDGPNEIDSFVEFLYLLMDNHGPQMSRYSPRRIYITVEPGDKYVPVQDQGPSV